MDTSKLLIPGSIVIAGLFIALALFFSNGSSLPMGEENNNGNFGNNNSGQAAPIGEVREGDHVFGNPDAPVTIVEYSDFECPFCARFHPTVERVVEESDGQVNWVYRHFPLTSIHPNAASAAAASECVARLSGNDAFWAFGKDLFDNQRSLGTNLYTTLAANYGVDASALTSCMAEQSVRDKVTGHFNEVIEAGGRGTPYSIIISASGQLLPFSGALPYEQVKQLTEQALEN